MRGMVVVRRAPAIGYHVAEVQGQIDADLARSVYNETLDRVGQPNPRAEGPQPIKVKIPHRTKVFGFIPVTRWFKVSGFYNLLEDGTAEFRLNVA